MKRYGLLMEKILSYENLMVSAAKAIRGKRSKCEVSDFIKDFNNNVLSIKESLENNTFNIGNYYMLKIYDPKERIICAASFKERILHHAIINVTHDFFEKKMIYDSYATRIGKGSHKAILRLKKLMALYNYYVKLDIKKYFDTIDHVVLKNILSHIFKDRDLLMMFDKIIESYQTEKSKGLPIGNLTSQYFANIYLSDLDHYMKENERVKVYIRYMDDVIMLGNSLAQVQQYAIVFSSYASENLQLTCKQAIYGRCRDGIIFLGFKVFPNHITLGSKAKKRFSKKISEKMKIFCEGKISEEEYKNCLNSLVGHAKFANSYNFRVNLQKKIGWE